MTNMVILTDAEYDQLTPVEKIDYWRRRFYAMEELVNDLKEDRMRLLARIHRATEALLKA